MYMGQIYGFLGMYLAKDFREAYPILVPMHIAIYVCAILQELYDIHGRHEEEEEDNNRRVAAR